MLGHHASKGNGTAAAPYRTAAAPTPAPARRDTAILLALVALVALVVGAEGCWVLPGLSGVLADTRRLRDELQWAKEREASEGRALDQARKEAVRDQATILLQQRTAADLAAENLRLAQELNKELAKRKAEQP